MAAAPPATGLNLQQCNLRLPAELVAWLDAQAAAAYTSRSAYVRMLIAREMRSAAPDHTAAA